MEHIHFEEILRIHAERYPQMTCQDIVKLCYQNEFGGGHLIQDEEKSLLFLRQEMMQTDSTYPDLLLEDIGNGLGRIHLGVAAREGITAEEIHPVFVQSARMHQGNQAAFIEKLDLVMGMVRSGVFSFQDSEYRAYLEQYRSLGYPMVSHSEIYRRLYRPSYRVVLRQLWEDQMRS